MTSLRDTCRLQIWKTAGKAQIIENQENGRENIQGIKDARACSLQLDKSTTKGPLRPISRFSQRTLGIQILKQAELRDWQDVRFFIIQPTPFWCKREIWAKTLIKKVFTPLQASPPHSRILPRFTRVQWYSWNWRLFCLPVFNWSRASCKYQNAEVHFLPLILNVIYSAI